MSYPRLLVPVIDHQTPEMAFISDIDIALNRIHDVFANAFAEGKSKPEGFAAQKLQLFESFWDMLSTPVFSSLARLNTFYNELKESHSQHLQAFCSALDISFAALPDNKIQMFLQLINIHHVLIRQKFILSLFIPYENQVANLEREAEKSEREYMSANVLEIRRNLEYVTIQLSMIAEKLNSLNYPEHPVAHEKVQRLFRDERVNFILDCLETLPLTNAMNHTTDALHEAYARKDKPGIKRETQVIMSYIDRLQRIKRELDEMLSPQIHALELALAALPGLIQSLRQRYGNVDQEIVNKGLKLISSLRDGDPGSVNNNGYREMSVIAQKVREACQSQSVVNTIVGMATMGYWEQGWINAGSQTISSVDQLVVQTGRFISSYTRAADAQKSLTGMRAQIEELEKLQVQLTNAVQKIKQTNDACMAALVRIESILLVHLAATDDNLLRFLKSFFGRHWLKMLLGGAGAGGTSTLVAVLLALEPTKLGILIAAASVVGTGLGAGAGITQDQFSSKKHSDTPVHAESGRKSQGADVTDEELDEHLPLISHDRESRRENRLYSLLPEWLRRGSVWSRPSSLSSHALPVQDGGIDVLINNETSKRMYPPRA